MRWHSKVGMAMGRHEVMVRWQPYEDECLRQHYGKRLVPELCLMLNRTYRSVCGRLHRLGLRKSTAWTHAELAWMLEQRGQMTHAEMAGFLGKTRKQVSRAVDRYGMKLFRHGLTEHEQRRYKNLHTRGYSDLMIARKMELTKSRVLRHRLRIGLDGHGHTAISAKARVENRPADFNERVKAGFALQRSERRMPESALIEIAMEAIRDDDELLSVAWDGINDAWKRGVDDRSALLTAAQDAIRAFRKDTSSYLSLDSFVDEDGKRYEMSEDKRLDRSA